MRDPMKRNLHAIIPYITFYEYELFCLIYKQNDTKKWQAKGYFLMTTIKEKTENISQSLLFNIQLFTNIFMLLNKTINFFQIYREYR